MLQAAMIERVRAACRDDERVVGALMFGSFATGEGDAFSDIEFAFFLRDDAVEGFDARSWLDQVAPVAAWFADDFGHHTALFHNGVRGELHVLGASALPVVDAWRGHAWFPSLEAAVLVDRTGELSRRARALVGGPPRRDDPALVENVALNLLNLMLFGANLLNRGEHARAWALLGRAHEGLLKLVRVHEGATDHWPTPSRALEQDLPPAAYARYVACTASARPDDLRVAYARSWAWSRELFAAVVAPRGVEVPASVVARVDALLEQAGASEA